MLCVKAKAHVGLRTAANVEVECKAIPDIRLHQISGRILAIRLISGIRCFAIFWLAIYPVAPDIRWDIDYPVDI
jgi:hypothetical protein